MHSLIYMIHLFIIIAGVVYFNHKYGCQKCLAVGNYDKDVRRMCYATFDAPERTDSSFRNREQPIHHKTKSLLEDLKNAYGRPLIDMVKQFPVCDPLHLLHEGAMKKLINIWMKGTTLFKKKWSNEKKSSFDKMITLWNKELPSDIARKVRNLQYLAFWKATEFRTVLLYYGMVAFKDLLDEEEYQHFMHLCLAIRIYSCKTYLANDNYKRVARKMLAEFCTYFPKLYGENAVVSNIHNLSHISEEVEQFGSLNEISTYPFEIFLHEIKLRVKPSNKPMEQITRRLAELLLDKDENKELNFNVEKIKNASWVPELKYKFDSLKGSVFKFIRITPNVFLSCKKIGDRWFLTKNGDIVEMKYAVNAKNTFYICGAPIEQKTDFFSNPFSSQKVDKYLSNGEKNAERLYHFKDIKAKLMCLSYKEQYVFIPLEHSMDECQEFS